jgi:hypothetical protein
LAAGLLLAPAPSLAQSASSGTTATADDYRAKAAQHALARRAFEEQAAAYWKSIGEKRQIRNAKRRSNEPIQLHDYVLTQPPVYAGPPRPVDPAPPDEKPTEPRKPDIPVVADFLAAAAEQFRFVPQPPDSEIAFKQAYVRVAAAAGLTRDQVVRIYAFETGGNGTYDVQAGLTHPKPGAKAISPAIGYNQLLSTNSVELLAESGDRFLTELRGRARELRGKPKNTLLAKIQTVERMMKFATSVPDDWSAHEKLAAQPQGLAIHALNLDIDVGPLLQTQKLLDSVIFAKKRNYPKPLTAAELEMMNLTGDGNGIDMIFLPKDMREQVPTSNFFQRGGYDRNPVASRNPTVAKLIGATDAKMDRESALPGAKTLRLMYDRAGPGKPVYLRE